MKIEKFTELMTNQLEFINLNVDNEKIEKFYRYMELLLEWNEKINLTAITEKEEIITKHFIDSLTVLKHTDEKDKIIDVGTGAGFPGIPLKIVGEKIKCTLLDSLNKRIKFLDQAIGILKVKDIGTIHARAEDLGRDEQFREQYDVAVSRAVAPLNILLEYLSPYVKIGGRCICMKGPNIQDELKQSKDAINKLGLEIDEVDNFHLPNTDMTRNIIVLNKIEKTKKIYPRKSVDIKKIAL